MGEEFENNIERIIDSMEGTRVIWPKTGYILKNAADEYLMAICGQAHGLVYCRNYVTAQEYARQSGEVNTVQKVQLRRALSISREKEVDGLVMGEHPDKCLLLQEKKPAQVFILSDVLNDIYGTYSVEKKDGAIVEGMAAFVTAELASFAKPTLFQDTTYLTLTVSMDEACDTARHKGIPYLLLIETEDLASPVIIPV